MTEDYDETLRDLIIEQGEEVFYYYWDSGGPGAGADCECVYLYDGQYYPILSDDFETKAYGTLEEVLQAHELILITEAVEKISFDPQLEEKLIPHFRYAGEQDKRIKINEARWLCRAGDGNIVKEVSP